MEGPDQFFDRMITQIARAFQGSDIERMQRAEKQRWSYSLCALPLRPGRPLLLGLNWGSKKDGYEPQTHMPGNTESEEVARYRFIQQAMPMLKQHAKIQSLAELNYLNVVPFRTPRLSLLSGSDWLLGIGSFFLETITYLRPGFVLLLGITAVHKIRANAPGLIPMLSEFKEREARGFVGLIGGADGCAETFPFLALPHPQARLSHSARLAIWCEGFDRLRRQGVSLS